MSSSAFRLPAVVSPVEAEPKTLAAKCVLAAVGVGVSVIVLALDLEDDLRDWLRAVGIAEGERLTVLRRAAFGGPIHVRTSSGGEFALNRALARSIHLREVREEKVP